MEAIESPFAGVLGGILYGISYSEIVVPLCFAFWVTLIFVPLRKIYLGDSITALTYIGFCAASAALVVLAIPMKLTPTNSSSTVISVITASIVLSALKWFLSMRKNSKIKSFELEKVGPDDN